MSTPNPAPEVTPAVEKAIVAMLERFSATTWTAFDLREVTAAERSAHYFLVDAGLLESRSRIRVRLAGHAKAMVAKAIVSGGGGLPIAMQQCIEAAWVEWKDHWQSLKKGETGGSHSIFCELLAQGSAVRVTEMGEQALADIKDGHTARVVDFATRRHHFANRPDVDSSGILESVEMVSTGGTKSDEDVVMSRAINLDEIADAVVGKLEESGHLLHRDLYYAASHYKARYAIPPERLRKAAAQDRIRSKMVGKTPQYSFDDVRAVWPEDIREEPKS